MSVSVSIDVFEALVYTYLNRHISKHFTRSASKVWVRLSVGTTNSSLSEFDAGKALWCVWRLHDHLSIYHDENYECSSWHQIPPRTDERNDPSTARACHSTNSLCDLFCRVTISSNSFVAAFTTVSTPNTVHIALKKEGFVIIAKGTRSFLEGTKLRLSWSLLNVLWNSYAKEQLTFSSKVWGGTQDSLSCSSSHFSESFSANNLHYCRSFILAPFFLFLFSQMKSSVTRILRLCTPPANCGAQKSDMMMTATGNMGTS